MRNVYTDTYTWISLKSLIFLQKAKKKSFPRVSNSKIYVGNCIAFKKKQQLDSKLVQDTYIEHCNLSTLIYSTCL